MLVAIQQTTHTHTHTHTPIQEFSTSEGQVGRHVTSTLSASTIIQHPKYFPYTLFVGTENTLECTRLKISQRNTFSYFLKLLFHERKHVFYTLRHKQLRVLYSPFYCGGVLITDTLES